MSSIGEVMGRFGEFYGAGSYQDALTLVNSELPNHPNDQAMLLCFSAAMSARLGDSTSALTTFQTALDAGYWYHEGALRGDPDFASLQDIDAFKALVEQNGQRRQAALAETKPIMHVLETADTALDAPLLIVLHGNLSKVDTYSKSWQSAVEQGWRVALPQSSRLSWLSGLYDWGDLETSLSEFDQHYQTLMTKYAAPSRLVIAGFSSGGMIAQRVTLSKRVPVQGLLWMESGVDENLKTLIAEHQPFDLRAYFVAGHGQDFIPNAEALAGALEAVGVPCQIEKLLSLYHEYPEPFAPILDRALAFLCG